MKTSNWSALRQGAKIEIVAPASSVRPESLQKSIDYLKQQGFQVRVHEGLLSPYLFHANTDENRFLFLKKALMSDADAIWAIRGGYGSNRLLPKLSQMKKPQKQKIFIGISDVTSLHLFFNNKWGWPTLHASLLDRIAQGKLPESAEKETLQILRGEAEKVHFDGLKFLNPKAEKVKKISGQIVGGNLMTLQSTIGTPYKISLQNKILFLEEIDERGYRIDRMLTHLAQSQMLNKVKGIVFGHFIGGDEPGEQKESKVWEAIHRFAQDNKQIPMWSGVESGHDVLLRPLPLGTVAVVSRHNLSVQTGVRV